MECLSFRKSSWELSVFSQTITIQTLCLKNRICLTLKIKFYLKMYFWLVNTLIIYYHQILPTIFDKWFKLFSDIHNYNLPASSTGKLFKPSFWSNSYRKKSLTISAVNAWNKIQTAFGNVILKNLTTTQIKSLLTKKCIEKYWQIIHLILTGRLC